MTSAILHSFKYLSQVEVKEQGVIHDYTTGEDTFMNIRDSEKAKRVPGFIIIRISGYFTFANFEKVIHKLDRMLTLPVVEEELKVRCNF